MLTTYIIRDHVSFFKIRLMLSNITDHLTPHYIPITPIYTHILLATNTYRQLLLTTRNVQPQGMAGRVIPNELTSLVCMRLIYLHNILISQQHTCQDYHHYWNLVPPTPPLRLVLPLARIQTSHMLKCRKGDNFILSSCTPLSFYLEQYLRRNTCRGYQIPLITVS